MSPQGVLERTVDKLEGIEQGTVDIEEDCFDRTQTQAGIIFVTEILSPLSFPVTVT